MGKGGGKTVSEWAFQLCNVPRVASRCGLNDSSRERLCGGNLLRSLKVRSVLNQESKSSDPLTSPALSQPSMSICPLSWDCE